jgi:hypothetical protein
MNSNRAAQHAIAGLLIAALGVASVTPAAEAHSRGGRSRGDGDRSYGGYRPRVVEIRRSSSALPAFVGFVGGLALGTVLARSSAHDGYVHGGPDRCVEQEPADYYYDPYSRQRFASLDECGVRFRESGECDHPRIVLEIDASSGQCEHAFRYEHGSWRTCDDQWSQGGRGYDRGRGDQRVYERDRNRDRDRDWNDDQDRGDDPDRDQ